MEILADDQQLKSLVNTYAYYCPDSKTSIIVGTSNPSRSSILQAYSKQKNHFIELCYSNASIVTTIENRSVDMVIIDEYYNIMEGIKLLDEIRNIDPKLPVVFINKTESELLSLHIWDLETNDYRTELIDPSKLVKILDKFINDIPHASAIEHCLQHIHNIQTFTVYDIYVIGSDGRLFYHHSNNHLTQVDEDIFSGMFTVLKFFLEDLFRNWPGELRTIDYQSLKILIEHDTDFYLVVVGKGTVLEPVREHMVEIIQHISRKYGSLIANWSGNLKTVAGLREEVAGIIKVE